MSNHSISNNDRNLDLQKENMYLKDKLQLCEKKIDGLNKTIENFQNSYGSTEIVKNYEKEIEILKKKLEERDLNSSSFWAGKDMSYIASNELEVENLKTKLTGMELVMTDIQKKYANCLNELENEKKKRFDESFKSEFNQRIEKT